LFSSRWLDYSISILAAVFLLVLTVNNVAGYSIQGDCVVEETAYYKISQCPHTLTDFTNYPNVTVWNKDNASHSIDIAFGFDTSNARPTQAWLWNLNAPHVVPTYGNVSYSYQCVSPNNFSYQLTPYKYFWCNSTNGTVVFEHSFVNGWIANKTAEWFEWGQNGTTIVYYPDWVDVSGAFKQTNWVGKTWFYRENVAFLANESKTLKMKVEVKPNTNGKYDLFAKLSSDSFQEALDSGRYVLLDPWFNASWNYRKPLNVNESDGLDRFIEPLTFNVTGLKLSSGNCSQELRVTAVYSTETEIPFQVLNASGQVFSSGSQYCVVRFNVNMTTAKNASYTEKNVTNYFVYYGNAVAPNPSYANFTSWNSTNFGFGNCTPSVCVGFTLQGGAGLSTYVYLIPNTTNYVWNYNTTSSYFFNYKTVASASRTFEMRGRWISGDNGAGAFLTIGATGTGGSAHLLVNDTVLKVAGWDGSAYNFKVISNGLEFHVYRLTWNVGTNAFNAYQDGVLMTSGTNATQADGVNRLYVGQVQDAVNVQNAEMDYFAITEGGLFPPLTAVLGAEELPDTYVYFNATCKDETTNAFLECNFAVSNSTLTYSESSVFALNYSNATVGRPTGTLTLTANKTGYSARSIPTYFSDSDVNVTVYLLNNSISSVHAIAVFTVTSAYGTVAGAEVNLSKMVGGSPVLVASGITDGFGTTSFFVDSTSSYQLNAFKAGYGGVVMALTNPLLTTYTIVFGSGVATAIPVTCLSGVSTALSPNSRQLFRGVNQNVSWIISITSNNLSYWGWRVDWNGTILNTSNNTNPLGGSINSLMDFNASNASGLVGVQYYWNVGSSADCVRNDVFFVNNVTGNTGLLGMLSSLKTDTGIGDNALGLLALIIIVSMVVFASRYTTVGGAAIGIITLAFFTFVTGWVNPIFFLVLAIGGIAWTYFAYERGF
jgi:hypothetical protein